MVMYMSNDGLHSISHTHAMVAFLRQVPTNLAFRKTDRVTLALAMIVVDEFD